ncbi:DNA-processing protein DprA [Kushneria aurantia]|uniref:DNA-processing protein DprA n=1 Tax=Kushneria aurantia TaxID=504092 RepID=A0ABV6G984_9GAMM|nr:DNA-processing protein DprA [Kushneria aurantia]
MGHPEAALDARCWLALALLPGLGPRRFRELRRQAPDWPDGWLVRLEDKPRRALLGWLQSPTSSALNDAVEAALEWRDGGSDRHLLHPGDPRWPLLLDEIDDPPPLLWAHGDCDALMPPALAVVGTRKPSREGQDNAHRFARDIAAAGYTVTSGMALGIDGCAHRGALDAGGRSVAVLGCGVDVLYPRGHAALRRSLLAEGGLLLSEHPPGTPARPAFFPRRNRIVTGLSLGVLVVEAAKASGSLISARLALEQNREVFALPGSLHNPQAQGCLWLIREGAQLVTDAEQLLVALPPGHGAPAPLHDAPSSPAGSSPSAPDDPLWALLDDAPRAVDLLVERSGFGINEVSNRLLMLELEGWACQVAGGWVRRRP